LNFTFNAVRYIRGSETVSDTNIPVEYFTMMATGMIKTQGLI